MFELTADNAAAFLRDQGWLDVEPVRIEELSGGVSNLVLRVETPNQRFILKQSAAAISAPKTSGLATWGATLPGTGGDGGALPFLPDAVPVVLHSSRDHYVFAMSHAPLDAVVWKESLLAGTVELPRAARKPAAFSAHPLR